MSDLEAGSLIGGEEIIHQGIANNHNHVASQIIGLGDVATKDVGSTGGINADVLSGYTYDNLSTQFIEVTGGTLNSILINNNPTTDSEAANKQYVDGLSGNKISSNSYKFTFFGNEQNLSFTVKNLYTISYNAFSYLYAGQNKQISSSEIDIRTVSINFKNTIFYIYIDPTNNTIFLSKTNLDNSSNNIQLGYINTDNNGISNLTIYPYKDLVGFEYYFISNNPKKNSIISTDNNYLDINWLYPGNPSPSYINGSNTIDARNTYQYTINNYNVFSVYDVHTNIGTVSINGDTITLVTPQTNPTQQTVYLDILRDDYDSRYDITLNADPQITLSGPTSVTSGNSYNYTINNYINGYTYTPSTNIGTVSIVNDVVTLTTPNTNPTQQTINLSVARTGSTATLNIDYPADPAIGLTGPTTVYVSQTYQYTITNYNPYYTYSVSSNIGTVTESNGIVTLTTPASNTTDQTLTITVSRTGSTASLNTLFKANNIVSNYYSINTPTNSNDTIEYNGRIAVDSNYNSYVGGYYNDGTNSYGSITKYDHNGNVLNSIYLTSIGSITDVKISNNNLYIIGYEFGSNSKGIVLIQLDLNLNILKATSTVMNFNLYTFEMTFDASFNIYIATYYTNSINTAKIYKFDSSLNFITSVDILDSSSGSAVTTDAFSIVFDNNYLYVSGLCGNDCFIGKLDTNLNLITYKCYSILINGSNYGASYPILSIKNNIIGMVSSSNTSNSLIHYLQLYKFDTNLNLINSNNYSYSYNGYNLFSNRGFDFDSNNNYYIIGDCIDSSFSSVDYYTVIDPNSFTVTSDYTISSTYLFFSDITIDNLNNSYISGFTTSSSQGEILLVKNAGTTYFPNPITTNVSGMNLNITQGHITANPNGVITDNTSAHNTVIQVNTTGDTSSDITSSVTATPVPYTAHLTTY